MRVANLSFGVVVAGRVRDRLDLGEIPPDSRHMGAHPDRSHAGTSIAPSWLARSRINPPTPLRASPSGASPGSFTRDRLARRRQAWASPELTTRDEPVDSSTGWSQATATHATSCPPSDSVKSRHPLKSRSEKQAWRCDPATTRTSGTGTPSTSTAALTTRPRRTMHSSDPTHRRSVSGRPSRDEFNRVRPIPADHEQGDGWRRFVRCRSSLAVGDTASNSPASCDRAGRPLEQGTVRPQRHRPESTGLAASRFRATSGEVQVTRKTRYSTANPG